jgi:hypothetical protein
MTPTNLTWLTKTSSGDGGNVVVNGATQSNKGVYTVTLTATVDSVSANTSIALTLQCVINSVDKTGSISAITYFIGSATLLTAMPTYVTNPACGVNTLSYTLLMQAGGTVPAAFSLDTTNMKFVITQGVALVNGIYNLKIVATENLCTSGTVINDLCLFTVTVKCTTSINILSNPIPATITYILNPNTLNTMTQALPTYGPSPSTCAYGFSYSVINIATGACAPWLSCAPTSNISIATTDWTLAGTYNFRINVSDSASDMTNQAVTFSVVIKIMNATSITKSTSLANQTYQINQAMMYVSLPTYTWYPTQSATVFSYSISAGPSFVTIAGSPQ